jgi:hypothetical protein
MAPPAAFYTVSSFPYSQLVTVADYNAGTHGDAANEVWFKYVATEAVAFGLRVSTVGAFSLNPRIFETDSLTQVLSAVDDAQWTMVVDTATNYWIRVRKTPAGSITDDLTVEFDIRPINPSVQPGDYLINDDTSGIPAIVMATDGTIRGVVPDVPSGEVLYGLRNGYVFVHDAFQHHGAGSRLVVLAPDLSLVSAFDVSPSVTSAQPPATEQGSLFYFLNRVNNNVYSVDTAGTATLLVTALPITGGEVCYAIGVNTDATILYYTESGSKAIKQYDLVGLAPLSDLYTVATADTIKVAVSGINNNVGEILVNTDGTIVTSYQNSTSSQSVLLHISSAGSLLHSYTYNWASLILNHISKPTDGAGFINVWFYRAVDSLASWRHIDITTGTADAALDTDLFSAGINLATASSTLFAPSTSCSFSTLLTYTPSPEIPLANSSECCASPGVEGSGETVPGAGVEHPVLLSPAWVGRCDGGGQVDLLPDLTDAEDWSDS